ncbi:MAG: WD40 repeat domain-containing protein [Sulfurovum sp.]|nr:WD40 repeat domain-containing protein [Sulfurovum sp.]
MRGHSNSVQSVAFPNDGKFIISSSSDNTVKLWSVEHKKLVWDMWVIRSHWVWFENRNKAMFRSDDGSLVLDKYSSQSILPKDNTPKDNLDIDIPKEIDIYSQQSVTVKVNITNLDKNTSYWISAISSEANIILYPNKIIKLKPKESKVLDFKLSSSLPIEDRQPFSKDINITFITANGVYETKKIKVNFKTPKIEISKAHFTPKDKTLIVEIINSGSEAIKDLKIKIGEDIQEIKNIEANAIVSKSFVLTKAPEEIEARIYKDFYEWNLNSKVSVESMFVLYIILAILIIVLIVSIFYYRRYKNPLV